MNCPSFRPRVGVCCNLRKWWSLHLQVVFVPVWGYVAIKPEYYDLWGAWFSSPCGGMLQFVPFAKDVPVGLFSSPCGGMLQLLELVQRGADATVFVPVLGYVAIWLLSSCALFGRFSSPCGGMLQSVRLVLTDGAGRTFSSPCGGMLQLVCSFRVLDLFCFRPRVGVCCNLLR